MSSVISNQISRLLHGRFKFAIALIILAVTIAIPLYNPQQVDAEVPFDGWQGKSAKWINRMTIEFNNVYFVDSDPSDHVFNFTYTATSNSNCVSRVAFNHENAFGVDQPSPYADSGIASEAGMQLFVPQSTGTGCDEVTDSSSACNGRTWTYYKGGGARSWTGCRINVGDTGARLIAFFQDTDGNIKSINPGQAISFVTAPNAWNGQTVYIRSDQLQAQCKNLITKIGGQWILFSLKTDDKGSTNWPQYQDIVKTSTGAGAIQQDRCSNNPDAFAKVYLAGIADSAKPTNGGYYNIYVGTTANQGGSKAANAGSTTPGAGTQPGGSAANNTKPTCESSGFSLNWILCPIYNATASFVDWMLSIIQAMLRSDDFLDPNKPIYAIWSQFRIYANIFLIIAILVIVFGQSIGTSVFEAYMVRTFLVRLFFVIGFVNLSIYIMAGFFDVVNILGSGIGAALTAPLNGAGMFKFTPTAFQQGGITVAVGGAGIAAAASGVLWGGLVSPQAAVMLALFVLLPAFFGILAIFVTLMALRAFRLLLVAGSPVAGALKALPNTEKRADQFVEWTENVGAVSIILPGTFAVCNIMSYLTITEAQSPERNIMTAKFTSVADMAMGYGFVLLPLVAGGFAFTMAGGITKRARDFAAGVGKRSHQAILGNENDPNSLRNKTRRRFGAAITQGQKNVLDRGENAAGRKGIVGAWQRSRARFVGSGMFGDVTQRQSTYNAIAAKERAAKTDTGDDSEIFAGAGYMIRRGQVDHTGTVDNDRDRYFNSKGGEINKVLYDRGKRLHGRNSHEVGEALMYTLGKAQTEDDKAAFRYAFAKNALEQGWSEGEMKGAYAHAAYPHKRNHASVWYSSPEYERDGNGRVTGVRFQDVGQYKSSYDKMITDLHASRGSFDLSGDRHEDFQVMRNWQTRIEDKMLTNPDDVTDQDRLTLGRTYEIFDAVSSRMQTMTDADGNVSTSGASPAAQQVILAAVNQRRLAMTEADSSGARTIFNPAGSGYRAGARAVAPPPGSTNLGKVKTAGGTFAEGIPGTQDYRRERSPRENMPTIVRK